MEMTSTSSSFNQNERRPRDLQNTITVILFLLPSVVFF